MKEITAYVSVMNIAFFDKKECEEFDEKVKNFLENVSYYDRILNKIEIKPSERIYQSADPMHDFNEKVRWAEHSARYVIIKEGLNFAFFEDFRTNLYIYDQPGIYFCNLNGAVMNLDDEIKNASERYKTLINIQAKLKSNI